MTKVTIPLAAALFLALGACSSEPGNTGSSPTRSGHASHQHRAAPQTQPADGRQAPLLGGMGNVNHPITTQSPTAQRYFDQGLALAYGFNHPEAERAFREAARLDPQAPMAWWGVALVLGPNINKPMDEAAVPKAWEALQKAQQLAQNGNQKERAYIAALAKRYAPQPSADRSALDRAYADAMRELAKAYPDDLDAATLFAEALMDTMPWDYWTKDLKPKPELVEIMATLERVMQRDPNHIGAAHYYIHAVEAGPEPGKALAAADRLTNLAPAAGHLVHMPSHIYVRVGLYREATLANERASLADETYIAQCNSQGFYPAMYYPHNVHFLWYALGMEGRSAESIAAAKKVAEHVAHAHGAPEASRLLPLPLIAMMRFGRWDDILAAPQPPQSDLFASAITHYARGLAYVGKNRIVEAKKEQAKLDGIAQDPKSKQLETSNLPGASLLKIAQHDLAGQIALAQGQKDQAIAEFQTGVKLEDELPYMEPPFWYFPVRHALGAALLSADRAKEAEAVYRADLQRNPNNGWALFGLTQALKAQGKDDAAREAQARFDQAWIRADVTLSNSRL